MTDDPYDAIVIGGGPAGAAAAILLSRAGWRVALLEKSTFPRKKVCGEFMSASNAPLLRELGVASIYNELAGPEVRELAVFCRDAIVTAPMPIDRRGMAHFGRAIGREWLDTLLLERAGEAGAEIHQPWKAITLQRIGNVFHCLARDTLSGNHKTFVSSVVFAADGSWGSGSTHFSGAVEEARRSDDLFGFKAHFHQSALRAGRMPLLAFEGGYGGMVHTDGGRVSLSCCVRHQKLIDVRRGSKAPTAGDAIFAHLLASCKGVREALDGATLEGAWLASGPMRPGRRTSPDSRLFLLGNAAGEAHPVIAEGISMALQSAWLASQALLLLRGKLHDEAAVTAAAFAYRRSWRKAFSGRITAAALFAYLAERPASATLLLPILQAYPGLITWGARWSGKTVNVIPETVSAAAF